MFIRLISGLDNASIIQNVYPQVIKNARFNLLILICILMNGVKNYTIIHFTLLSIVESCNTLNDLRSKVWVPNKTKDLHLCVFNMIIGINESKTLTKHISWKCKCKFNGRKYNSNEKWNNYICRCKCKNHNICEKNYIWNPATCSYKNI